METQSRRGFLRQLGTGLAAGVGVALIPAVSKADTESVNCCPNCTKCNCGACGAGKRKFFCDCGACCSYCTGCLSRDTCYTGPC